MSSTLANGITGLADISFDLGNPPPPPPVDTFFEDDFSVTERFVDIDPSRSQTRSCLRELVNERGIESLTETLRSSFCGIDNVETYENKPQEYCNCVVRNRDEGNPFYLSIENKFNDVFNGSELESIQDTLLAGTALDKLKKLKVNAAIIRKAKESPFSHLLNEQEGNPCFPGVMDRSLASISSSVDPSSRDIAFCDRPIRLFPDYDEDVTTVNKNWCERFAMEVDDTSMDESILSINQITLSEETISEALNSCQTQTLALAGIGHEWNALSKRDRTRILIDIHHRDGSNVGSSGIIDLMMRFLKEGSFYVGAGFTTGNEYGAARLRARVDAYLRDEDQEENLREQLQVFMCLEQAKRKTEVQEVLKPGGGGNGKNSQVLAEQRAAEGLRRNGVRIDNAESLVDRLRNDSVASRSREGASNLAGNIDNRQLRDSTSQIDRGSQSTSRREERAFVDQGAQIGDFQSNENQIPVSNTSFVSTYNESSNLQKSASKSNTELESGSFNNDNRSDIRGTAPSSTDDVFEERERGLLDRISDLEGRLAQSEEEREQEKLDQLRREIEEERQKLQDLRESRNVSSSRTNGSQPSRSLASFPNQKTSTREFPSGNSNESSSFERPVSDGLNSTPGPGASGGLPSSNSGGSGRRVGIDGSNSLRLQEGRQITNREISFDEATIQEIVGLNQDQIRNLIGEERYAELEAAIENGEPVVFSESGLNGALVKFKNGRLVIEDIQEVELIDQPKIGAFDVPLPQDFGPSATLIDLESTINENIGVNQSDE